MSNRDELLIALTHNKCPAICTIEHCIIGGTNICAHPKKGSFWPQDSEHMARHELARKILGHNIQRHGG